MKKTFLLFIFALNSIMLLWAQNTVVYSVTAKFQDEPIALDSVVFENLTNPAKVVVPNLPAETNVITISNVLSSVHEIEQTEGFTLVQNQKGNYQISNEGETPLQAIVSVININGQICKQNTVNMQPNSPLGVSIDNAGVYFIVVQSFQTKTKTFKVFGNNGNGTISIGNISGAAQFKKDNFSLKLKKAPGAVAADFSEKLDFNINDQLKVSVYKKNFAADPQTITISGDVTLDFILTQIFPEDHPFARLAEYNVSATPSVFTDSHDNDKSGYFTWDEAQTASPEGYVLPSVAEIATFIPTNTDASRFLSDALVDYRIIGSENNRAAYRYEKVNGDDNGRFTLGDTKSGLRITGRYLGSNTEITLDIIEQETWWAENKDNDITHFFPYTGQIAANATEVSNLGQRMHYKLLDVPTNTNNCLILHSLIVPGGTNNIYVGGPTVKAIKGSVRCIREIPE